MFNPAILLAASLAAGGDCTSTFDQVAASTETEYAGFVVKLATADAQRDYARFRDLLRQRASEASGHEACRDILESYLGFFADHHLFVASRDNPDPPLPKPARRWTERRIDAYLADAAALDPVEGRWFDADGSIAVVSDPALGSGKFLALRTGNRAPAQPIALLARADGGYRIDWPHESWGWQRSPAHLRRGGNLLVFGTRGWGRAGATRLHGADPMAPYAQSLGDGVHYLSMPSFMPQQREPLHALIAAHGAKWAEARALIVDVRGNAGGDAIYFPLAPYFLANDIEVSRPTNVRASTRTVAYFESFRQSLGPSGAWLDEPIARMKSRPGTIVTYREGQRDGMPSYPDRPGLVIVLQDRGVGSAAEAFIFHARQSAKVLTMGQPTKGNIDYMQVSMHPVGSEPSGFWFGYPR